MLNSNKMSLLLFPGREKVRLPSVEYPVIYRDPIKSIHTRKYEPVEIGDVEYLMRDCPDRISDYIQKYPRAQTIFTGSGENRQLSTISNMYGTWGNPYKVNKEFRPPIIRPTYDLLPLSRMKRPNTSVAAQAHFPYPTRIETMKVIDFSKLKTSVWSLPAPDQEFVLGDICARPDASTYISPILLMNSVRAPVEAPAGGVDVCRIQPKLEGGKIYLPVTSNPTAAEFQVYNINSATTKKMKDVPLVSVLCPGFDIAVYDATTRSIQKLDIKTKDKTNFAVATARKAPLELPSRSPTEPIRLKDYHFFILERPDGSTVLTIDPRPNALKDLKKNLPKHFARTNVNNDFEDIDRVEPHNVKLSDKEYLSAQTRPILDLDIAQNRETNISDRLHLQEMHAERNATINVLDHHQLPTLHKKKAQINPHNDHYQIQWPNYVAEKPYPHGGYNKNKLRKLPPNQGFYTSPNYTINAAEFCMRN